MSDRQSLADGMTGAALLHLETGNWPAAREALRRAAAGGVSIGAGASLYYGAPALAFVLATASCPGLAPAQALTAQGTAIVTRQRLAAAHHRIDRHEQPHYDEYDLIRGLTGLGVTARRLGDHDLLRDILDYLVRLTEPIGTLPGWWCQNTPGRGQLTGGHANFGMAHGITGPLALLALSCIDRITVDGHATAISRICRWLDTWQQAASGITWWPQAITRAELHRGASAQQTPLRPSWCYGTPGIARAQQLAAQALRDPARQHLAETAFASCVTDPSQTRLLTGRGLCHGTAGLLATARRIAGDSCIPMSLAPLQDLHRQAPAAPRGTAGLLDGTVGADLAADGTTATSWDACLLLT